MAMGGTSLDRTRCAPAVRLGRGEIAHERTLVSPRQLSRSSGPKGLDVDVRATGLENIPTEGPVLLAANHVSYPDFIFIEKAAIERGRYVRFMTRHDIWHQPALGRAMDRMQHIPVDREAPAAAYLTARRLLARARRWALPGGRDLATPTPCAR